MGRAHNAASLQYSQLLRKEQTSEIHIIIQDKQNSNSSSLKISSYLTLKVGENQTEDKVKKKKKSEKDSIWHFHKLYIVVTVRAYSTGLCFVFFLSM